MSPTGSAVSQADGTYTINDNLYLDASKSAKLMAQLNDAKAACAKLQTQCDASMAGSTKLQAQLKDANAHAADLQAKLDQAQADLVKLQPKAKK